MSSSEPSSKSQLTKAQREALRGIVDWGMPVLESRGPGEQYDEQMIAGLPDLFNQSYDQYSQGQYNDLSSSAINDLISGKPAYQFDAGETTKRWKDTYAEPVMNAWKEQVMPGIKESMNMPGSLYSRGTSDYMGQQANDFYGSQVAPTLFSALQTGEQMGFQSGENANAMRAGALNLPYQQFAQGASAAGMLQSQEQSELTAAYQEYLRTDPFRYAQLLGGMAVSPTQDTIVDQGGGGILGGAMSGAMIGGSVGGPYAAAAGGVIGGVAGAFA